MTAVMEGVALEAPAPERMIASLLDTFTPVEGRVEPTGLYVTLNCMDLPASKDICTNEDPWTDSEFSNAEVIDGARFVSDIGIKCHGLGWGDLTEQFQRVVNAMESASVEQNVMALRFTGTAGGAAAVDLTPGSGAVTPTQGLSILEGHSARHYAGRATIHTPVTVASLLTVQYGFKMAGQRAFTPLGSNFVAGAGYEDNLGPTGAPPAAGEMWVYASGGLQIVRGKRVELDPILSRVSNMQYLRSQRVYVVSVDCYLAAVRVKVYG